MSAATTKPRGRPLVALGGIMVCWVGIRVALLQFDGFTASEYSDDLDGMSRVAGLLPTEKGTDAASAGEGAQGRELPMPTFVTPPSVRPMPLPSHFPAPTMDSAPALDSGMETTMSGGARSVPVRTAAGHQLLWMAALSRLPLPAGFARPQSSPPAPFFPAGRAPVSAAERWSADGWLMLRHGGTGSLATGAAPSTYGASQAGGVVRYRLSVTSPHRPAAYVRATSALNGVNEKEAALGLSARPLPRVPVVAAIELRASDQSGRTELRPAAMVVSELQPIDLPLGTRAEFYGQAGYVGGRFSTAFADAQLRIDTKVADFGPAEVRAGAGSWAGAQKGASRVDIGPTATVGMPLGKAGFGRLGVDWRQRVSGSSEPGSGPALTLSAGF